MKMIKGLVDSWNSSGLMGRMFECFKGMLEDTRWMFDTSVKSVFGGVADKETTRKLQGTDVMVNQAERRIRRQIIEHLTLKPGVDVEASLVLMSVVKDVERIGDYCKNIYELCELVQSCRVDLSDEDMARFSDLGDKVAVLFDKTVLSFADASKLTAFEVVKSERTLTGECEEQIRRIAASKLPPNRAVGFTLLVRSFKRVTSHLGNIATSLVMPVDQLDYFDEDHMDQTIEQAMQSAKAQAGEGSN